MLKKFALLFLSAVFLISVAAGCTKTPAIDTTGLTGSLEIRIFDGGYGTQWIKNIGAAYERANKGVKITYKTTVEPLSDITKIEQKIYIGDIFVHTTNINPRGIKGEYLALNDIYTSVPDGETDTVETKLGQKQAEILKAYNGNYYSLPFTDGFTGIVYNKTALINALGSDYKLPNTSDELLTLCNSIVNANKSTYPFVYTIDTNAEYPWWLTYNYMAQMTGYESYNNLYDGKYLDAQSGAYVQDLTGDVMYSLKEKEYAIKAVQQITSESAKMASPWCDSMDFAEAQAYFLGKGYGSRDKNKAVFMMNGDWVYNEMAYLFEENNPQEILFMRTPIISKIIEFCPDKTVENDAELSALIAAIDAGSTALTGTGYSVSQADFDKVNEARNIQYGLMSQQVATIPFNSRKPALAKDFLTFMASDTACAMWSAAQNGDLSLFNRSVAGAQPNAFIKSKQDIINDDTLFVMGSGKNTTPFNMGLFAGYFYYSSNLLDGIAWDKYSNDTYKNAYLSRYSDAVKAAGLN